MEIGTNEFRWKDLHLPSVTPVTHATYKRTMNIEKWRKFVEYFPKKTNNFVVKSYRTGVIDDELLEPFSL